jgi:aspartyl-tRNA(Asn)/glutamyl-tRNA(Gln) amidotransferase subunit A
MNTVSIGRSSAVEIARRVRSREITPVEVIDAVLHRMEHLEPSIHAFCTPTPEEARAAACGLEQAIGRGDEVGPLAGVPVSVKDLISTAGIRTTGGSAIYRSFVPDEDDIVVQRLKAAGAIIVGKTNVPEFGYSGTGHNSLFETTRNPWHTDLTPGGSSSGAGAAVAAGLGPVAIGSDGGGSIRIPAAMCGVFGMKASMGRVPLYPGCRDERYPGLSSWESLEHLGPLSRTVEDAALVLSVIAGPDPRDRHSIPCADVDWLAAASREIRGLRVALSMDWGYAAVDPEVRQVVSRAADVFEQLGCVVEERNPGWTDPFQAFWGVVAHDTDLAGLRSLLATHGSDMSPHLVDFLLRPWTAEEFTNARAARQGLNNAMWRFMADFDLVLTPTVCVPPFPVNMQGPEKVDGRMVRSPLAAIAMTAPINLTGQPAASVPAGFTASGLPVGMQIIGRHLDDATVLAASAAFEAAAPWADSWPGLLDELGL